MRKSGSHQSNKAEHHQTEQGQQGAGAGDDDLFLFGLAQGGGQVGAGESEVQQHHPAGHGLHIGHQAEQQLGGACEEQVQAQMGAGDLENGATVFPGEGEIEADTEQHQGADGITDEAGALGDDLQHADVLQNGPDAQQIQGQTCQTADHQGGGHDLLQQLAHFGARAGVGGQDGDDGDADEALGQVQHAHAVGLGGAEEQDGQGDAQHAGLHGTGQQGQVGVGQGLLADPEGDEGAHQGEAAGDGHGAQGFHIDLGGQAGVEEHAGQGEADDELGQALDLGGGDELFGPGGHAQGGAEQDGQDDHCHMEKFFHNLPL